MTEFWRQFLAILPVYVLQFCYGMSGAYPSITTPELTMDCALFPITPNQESNIVSIDNLISPIICILSGSLQQKFGPRTILILNCLPYLFAWIGAALSGVYKNVWFLYISRLCAGAGNGLLSTTIYTVEVTSKEMRGSFSVFEGVTRSLGMIVVYALGAFMSWNNIAYVGILPPAIAFLLLLKSPESPVYLIMKGEMEKAEHSLKRLSPHKDVSIKIQSILESSNKAKDSTGKTEGKWKILRDISNYPHIYKPFIIISLLSLIQQFSGATVIRGYVVKIFGEVFHREATQDRGHNISALCQCDCVSGNPLSQSAYFSAIIIGIIRLVASLCLSYLLVHFRRRSLYLASALGTILSLATFASVLLLSDHLRGWELGIPQATLSLFSLLAACSLVFSVNLGVQPMPLLMSSELYPPDLRAFCKGISRSLTCLMMVVSLKLFPFLEASLRLSGSFFLYLGVVVCGVPFIMIVLPETKDLSICQINNMFEEKISNKE